MTWFIFSLGIILVVFSLGFFLCAWRIRFKEMDAGHIKEIWPRFSYARPQLVDKVPDYKEFVEYINSYVGKLNRTSMWFNIISGVVTLISGFALLLTWLLEYS